MFEIPANSIIQPNDELYKYAEELKNAVEGFNRYSRVELIAADASGITLRAYRAYSDHVYQVRFGSKTVVKRQIIKGVHPTQPSGSKTYDKFTYEELKYFDNAGYSIHPTQVNQTGQEIEDWYDENF